VQQCGARVFDLILRIASGEQSKSEALGFGADEFAPWVVGATM
jgi:altronate hydrolase